MKRPEKKHVVGDFKEAEIAFDRVNRHAKFSRNFRVGQDLSSSGGNEILGKSKLVEVGNPPKISESALKEGPSEIPQPDTPIFLT
jgi:hypothetical protein